jgi:hypothetical protein
MKIRLMLIAVMVAGLACAEDWRPVFVDMDADMPWDELQGTTYGTTSDSAYRGDHGVAASNLAYTASTNAEAARVIATNTDAVAALALPKTFTNSADVQALTIRGATPVSGAVWTAQSTAGDGAWRPSIGFHAFPTVGQAVTNETVTIIKCTNLVYNIGDCYSIATSRFTPTVEGRYLIQGVWFKSGTGATTRFLRNGTTVYVGVQNTQAQAHSMVVYMNGVTDYIELAGYHAIGTTQTNSVGGNYTTFFSGNLLP